MKQTEIDELIERINKHKNIASNSSEAFAINLLKNCKTKLQEYQIYLKPQKDWQDRDDELTEAIDELHPCETGDHQTYTKAMELIGNRHSKGSLVCLVNYFLVREKQFKAMQDRVEDLTRETKYTISNPKLREDMKAIQKFIKGE